MASCKDCLHVEVCKDRLGTTKYYDNVICVNNVEELCKRFKDCSKFIEVPSTNLPIKVFFSDDTDRNYILRDYYYKSDDGIFMMTISCIGTQKFCTRKLSDFGKTVFLTKEEAEKALEEREINS